MSSRTAKNGITGSLFTLSLNPDYESKVFIREDLLDNLHEARYNYSDYRLPDINGLELLKRIRQDSPDTQVVLISEQNDINVVVSLLKIGAYDYITKSEDIKERLLITVQNIRKGIGLKKELAALRKEVQQKYSFRNTIIGESSAIKKVYGLIEKAIGTNITVIISGETGTGKELVAKAIHFNSARKDRPFVPVNIASIPSELIESELFGHEKGAFTGASSRRTGRFEEADGGTLFLDEIGEMELNLQSKLLRVLQEKEVVRVGSNKPVSTDCRVIVETNKNLKEEVRKGKFREDLYYRLFGLPIEMPPLRERESDILILARHFISRFCKENNIPLKRMTEAAQKKLMSYSFPGNVRELKSVVELAVTLSDKDELEPADLMLDSPDPFPVTISNDLTLREYELKIIMATLQKYDNDIRKTAEKLDIGVSTIYRILQKGKGI